METAGVGRHVAEEQFAGGELGEEDVAQDSEGPALVLFDLTIVSTY